MRLISIALLGGLLLCPTGARDESRPTTWTRLRKGYDVDE